MTVLKRLTVAAAAAAFFSSAPCFAAEHVDGIRNILWDGGFDIGFGNAFWGVLLGNQGPNRRDMWRDGAVIPRQTVASRVYHLDDGVYTLCAWVRCEPEPDAPAEQEPLSIRLTLTNKNYYRDRQQDVFSRRFPVPRTPGWHRVGWSFEIAGAVRSYFHVEIAGSNGLGEVSVDAVCLIPGDALPDEPHPAATLLAGFSVPEETGIYLDGEERVVELVIRNAGPARDDTVHWDVFDHHEEKVLGGRLEGPWPAHRTVRRRLPLDALPWGGYRFACSVQGESVLGDGLAAFLPRIDQAAFPRFGGDAAINPRAAAFTSRWMQRMGMSVASLLSPGGIVGRWSIAHPTPETYHWQDAAVDAAVARNIRLIGFLGMKRAPTWVQEQFLIERTVSAKGIKDEKGFTNAFCAWVDAFVRHYGNRIPVIVLEDEIHGHFPKREDVHMLARIYTAAYDTAKQAARDVGASVTVGINGTYPQWWDLALDELPRDRLDFTAQNSNLRPWYSRDTLNLARDKGVVLPVHRTMGVGQKSQLRRTSLILDRAATSSNPPGLHAWQALMHWWLSRPYGHVQDPNAGPEIVYGYYDLRVLGQAVYLPHAGKTCFEYDNSPNLGIQAMSMAKYQIQGLSPVRDPSQPYTLQGAPTASERLFAYPFRDADRAVVVLMTEDNRDLGASWLLSGADFSALAPRDLYAQPVRPRPDGALQTRELPVYLHVAAAYLDTALAALGKVTAEPLPEPSLKRFEMGEYILEVDPKREGLLRFTVRRDEQDTVILDHLDTDPDLGQATVDVQESRLSIGVTLSFEKGAALGAVLTADGLQLRWHHLNGRAAVVRQTVRFRVGQAGAGRDLVIQEGNTVRAGRTRPDYGEFYPAAATPEPAELEPGGARVGIDGFAVFDLPGSSGKGLESGPEGFRWVCRDGEAFLETDYGLEAPKKRGAGNRTEIRLGMTLR